MKIDWAFSLNRAGCCLVLGNKCWSSHAKMGGPSVLRMKQNQRYCDRELEQCKEMDLGCLNACYSHKVSFVGGFKTFYWCINACYIFYCKQPDMIIILPHVQVERHKIFATCYIHSGSIVRWSEFPQLKGLEHYHLILPGIRCSRSMCSL